MTAILARLGVIGLGGDGDLAHRSGPRPWSASARTALACQALVDDPRVAPISATGSTGWAAPWAPQVVGPFGRLLLEAAWKS
jgi:hypothetical protein